MPGQRGSLPRPIRHPTRAPVTKHTPSGCKQSRTPAQPWVAPASCHEGQRWGSTWLTPPIPRHGAPRGAVLTSGPAPSESIPTFLVQPEIAPLLQFS
jgi:hypothetical protein